MTSYGLNACPPLLVGVGIATSIDTAAVMSKKALMRPVSSKAENEKAAYMEQLLEDGINALHLGPLRPHLFQRRLHQSRTFP